MLRDKVHPLPIGLATTMSPAQRPLQALSDFQLKQQLRLAMAEADGMLGAHCVNELWMRGEMSINIERALEQLWDCAAVVAPGMAADALCRVVAHGV